MHNLKLQSLLVILFFSMTTASAQNHHFGGIIIDSIRYKAAPIKSATRTSTLGSRRSLRELYPISPSDQGEMGACGCCSITQAFDFSVKLMTKRACPGKKLPDQFSWSFLFNQLCPANACDLGIILEQAMDLVVKEGICSAESFKNDQENCSKKPTLEHKQLAAQYKPLQWKRVFELPAEGGISTKDTTGLKEFLDKKIRDIIGQIDQETPVIVIISFAGDFYNCDALFQKTDSAAQEINHAMLITGYDDDTRTFELLNSFGSQWCNGGFARVDYDALARVAHFGYVLKMGEPDCGRR